LESFRCKRFPIESKTTSNKSESSTSESDDENKNKQTTKPNTNKKTEEDHDITIFSDDNDSILKENHEIAAPAVTTYNIACYISRDTSPTRTLASYNPITNFTIPANTNSFLDNSHYQAIKTHPRRRRILTKEPLKSLILDGVAIQLHVPSVYYAIKGGNKQEVPLPLDPETMARIPEPKYYTNTGWTMFALLSIYFIVTLDYYYVIQKTIKKRIQQLQEKPHQSHPIDRILLQYITTRVSRQTQTSPEDAQAKDNNNKSTSPTHLANPHI
jgi:hypothetical protein